MRIFLDVGTHEGQTLEEVTKPRWEFDKVVGFEPMEPQRRIAEDAFPSVAVMPFGLSDKTGMGTLYGDNSHMEASVFATHRDADPSITTDALIDLVAWASRAAGVLPGTVEGIRAELEDIMDLLTSDFQITKQELVELASFTAHIERATDTG